MKTKRYPRVLAVAGSDSGGGAGLQADLKTISALGCYGLTVVTALTAQNTLGVSAIHPVPAGFIAAQGEAVLGDIGADAAKIGMLHSPETAAAVADVLARFDAGPVVLDPVMAAAGGDRLIEDDAVAALKERLFPLADLITPNLDEAEIILGTKLESVRDMREAASALCLLTRRAALLKGGHADGPRAFDFFAEKGDPGAVRVFSHARVLTANVHGAGCALSSAIASFLARGERLPASVEKALDWLHRALAAGARVSVGRGHGPPNHFFRPRRLRARALSAHYQAVE